MQREPDAQKKDPRHPRRKALKKIISILGTSLAILAGIYILTGLLLNFRFLISDAKEKIGIVKGAMISMRVIGEPEKPTLVAGKKCDSLLSKVILTWNETIDTSSYDIERNDSPLITGLTETSFEDTSAYNKTTNTYAVIAQGPRGSTASNPVVIKTEDCGFISDSAKPIIVIGGKNITEKNGIASIVERTPVFSGATNIPNARMTIKVASHNPTIVTLDANENGYWSWVIPFKLSRGLHELTIIATDPVNSGNIVTDTKYFKVISAEEEKDEKTKKTQKTKPIDSSPVASTIQVAPLPEKPLQQPNNSLEIALRILNSKKVVFMGEDLKLETIVIPKEILIPHELDLAYKIHTQSGEDILFQQKEKIALKNHDPLRFLNSLQLPVLLSPGRYIISAQTTASGTFVSSEISFEVREVPLFSIGSISITWSMIMKSISWVLVGILLIIFFFFGLLGLEHHRVGKALLQITENILMKKGYFSRRKGVSR